MKFELNKNLFKVTHEGKEGYVIIDEISVSKEGKPYRGSISGNIYIKQKGVIQAGDKIIASTFPLSDLPQFVIEEDFNTLNDDIDILRNFDYPSLIYEKDLSVKESNAYKNGLVTGYKKGWNKHAEKYKFTKEDLIKAVEMATILRGIGSNKGFYTEEEIIQSLQKRKEITEIEFETEINQCDGCMSNYPIINGVHQVPYPGGKMVCKANLYNNLKITKSIKYPYGLLTIKNVNYN